MSFGRLYASAPTAPRCSSLLRGGYCLNALVPWSSADYYEQRLSIAIARPPDTLQLDANWRLPELATSIEPLLSNT